jgi:hypothetical protein
MWQVATCTAARAQHAAPSILCASLPLPCKSARWRCRYQAQAGELQVGSFRLAEQLDEQRCKLRDINDFLVNELKARALSCAVLQGELTEAVKARDAANERCEARPLPLRNWPALPLLQLAWSSHAHADASAGLQLAQCTANGTCNASSGRTRDEVSVRTWPKQKSPPTAA